MKYRNYGPKLNITGIGQIFTKLVLVTRFLATNSYTEFHINPTNNLVTDIRAKTDRQSDRQSSFGTPKLSLLYLFRRPAYFKEQALMFVYAYIHTYTHMHNAYIH